MISCQLVPFGNYWKPFLQLEGWVRIAQFLAHLVNYKCSEVSEEFLGVIDKMWIYIISKFLRLNFLSKQCQPPGLWCDWLGLCGAWSPSGPWHCLLWPHTWAAFTLSHSPRGHQLESSSSRSARPELTGHFTRNWVMWWKLST